MDALFKIKKNVKKPVFSLAMKSLLQEFERIKDIYIQKEILYAIASSSHHSLIEPLEELIKNNHVSEEVINETQDSIIALKMIA